MTHGYGGECPSLGRYMLEYFWVKCQDVCNLFSNYSEKKVLYVWMYIVNVAKYL